MSKLFKGFTVATLGLLLVMTGCAQIAKPPVKSVAPAVDGGTYSQKALQYEKKGQWQLALMNWELAAKLKPEDPQIAAQLAKLKSYLNKRAQEQFNKGLALYKKGNLPAAREAFVAALRYNPGHQGALAYLKEKPAEGDYMIYEVQNGESLQQIARKIYNDADKDFLIAYFNGLNKTAEPPAGTALLLPNLATELTKPVFDVAAEVGLAKSLLQNKHYLEVLPITDKILDYDPTNVAAAELANEAQYEMGKQYLRDKHYIRAREMLSKVDPEYKDVQKILTQIDVEVAEQAEIHYRRGIKHFLNEKLEGAILEWSKTLALRPDHKKAQKDIENARRLLEKLEKVK